MMHTVTLLKVDGATWLCACAV